MTYDEAASVTDIGTAFYQSNIKSFDEFEAFTSVSKLKENAFAQIRNEWSSIHLPNSIATIEGGSFSNNIGDHYPKKIYIRRTNAPTMVGWAFARGNATYMGNTTEVHVPVEGVGYDSGGWLQVVNDPKNKIVICYTL